MIRSYNYMLPYLKLGDLLYEGDERERWNALDNNMHGIAKLSIDLEYGNAIISGLAVSIQSDPLSMIYVTAGSAFIDGIKVSIPAATIPSLIAQNIYTVYAEKYSTPSISSYEFAGRTLATLSDFINPDGRVEIAKIFSY